MTRPCFLVVDREYAGTISTRKLVIETAKFNVITAYSAEEAVEMLQRFPAVNGIVLDAGVRDLSCEAAVQSLKAIGPSVPIAVICTPKERQCGGADYYLDSFEPAAILKLLQKLEPEQTAVIQKQDERLIEEE